MNRIWRLILVVAVGGGCAAGCRDAVRAVTPSWHTRCGWDAEVYFDDPQVVALCEAIEADDLAEMKRLIQAGADVNTRGEGNMTPLLWAYPDNKLARFKLLLEQGADPNVIIESDFNTHGGMSAGDSVTHMACKTRFPGYFEAVFENGAGDPNLESRSNLGDGDTPLFTVIKFGRSPKKDKIKSLLERGANINHIDNSGYNAAMLAVGWASQFDIGLMLLEAGASHRVYHPGTNSRLIHNVLAKERARATWSPQQRASHKQLLEWLENQGDSIEEAKADRERWKSWSFTTGEYRRKMDAEVAERKQRERRERKAAEAAERQVDAGDID